jgi:plastocyanin
MQLRRFWGFALTVTLTGALTIACGGGKTEAPSTSGAPKGPEAATKVDESQAGDISGKVMLEGKPGPNDPIKMNADPVCVREGGANATQEYFVVGDGGTLGNVFVYVKDGLGNRTFNTPTEPAVIDQKGCRYHPHVFGIMVGQPLEIVNSDPTLHNIHALPKSNSEFNTAEPVKGMKVNHSFTAKEVMVPFKCDVHGWMNAYVGVLDHPYYAVSGQDGKFDIKTLPAGTYTIEAWHEKLGVQSQQVTLGAKEKKDITFTFKSNATN